MAKQIVRDTLAGGQSTAAPETRAVVPTAVLEGGPAVAAGNGVATRPAAKRPRALAAPKPITPFAAASLDDHSGNRQAELFYLQKQIQQQTQMIFVMEDGSRVQGVVEWYDRHSIKVRGKLRVLIYKAAIKYLYKAGEAGSHSTE